MQHVHITNSVPFINEKGCREIGGQLTWQVLRSFLPVIFKNKLDQQAKRQPLTGEKKAELTTRGCGISKRGCPSLMPRRSHNFRQWSFPDDASRWASTKISQHLFRLILPAGLTWRHVILKRSLCSCNAATSLKVRLSTICTTPTSSPASTSPLSTRSKAIEAFHTKIIGDFHGVQHSPGFFTTEWHESKRGTAFDSAYFQPLGFKSRRQWCLAVSKSVLCRVPSADEEYSVLSS